jgi:hypothetical protein
LPKTRVVAVLDALVAAVLVIVDETELEAVDVCVDEGDVFSHPTNSPRT